MTRLAEKTSAPAVSHAEMANAIRALAMDAVEAAQSGHPGMPMGMADVATVLFTEFLNIDPAHPQWPDRDRFILSAGHGSMLQYALHYLLGYADMTLDQLKHFRQWGAKTAGHPEYGHALGIETTTGPLGQGLANSVGFALAERMLAAQFGADVVDHYTYVIAGDGCLMEGISQEAISMAGHWKLNRLIVLFDDNGISIDGPTSLSVSDNTRLRFEASGWDVQEIDGHNPAEIRTAIAKAKTTATPSLIACKTKIGFGAPSKEGSEKCHGSPLGKDEIAGARAKLNWPHAPFEIPAEILAAWREAGARGGAEYAAWAQRFAAQPANIQAEFTRRAAGELPADWATVLEDFKQKLADTKPTEATRKSSENVLNALAGVIPELVGGSADLTGSNNTKAKIMQGVQAPDYAGRYIYYGVREHGMAAAMNGLALHGGFIPYGGTFLVFTDYCRPAIRLSALMNQRVIYVMTHDSIGLGEDGPTHQPVEHVASLRAIPNLLVFRPADAVETAECWALALAHNNRPSVLALSRQNLPALRTAYTIDNLCARGGYVIQGSGTRDQGAEKAVLIATGSEVSLAVEAQKKLAAQGIAARVVSMPSQELFLAQPQAYRDSVLLPGTPRVVVEAGIDLSWHRFMQAGDAFIGMQGFGASAPAPELYRQFGITADAVVKAVMERVK